MNEKKQKKKTITVETHNRVLCVFLSALKMFSLSFNSAFLSFPCRRRRRRVYHNVKLATFSRFAKSNLSLEPLYWQLIRFSAFVCFFFLFFLVSLFILVLNEIFLLLPLFFPFVSMSRDWKYVLRDCRRWMDINFLSNYF